MKFKSHTHRIVEGPTYVLKDWPTNYRMYIHKKGAAANPREDVYLFGMYSLNIPFSEYAKPFAKQGSVHSPKYRSPAEFIPHAIWLSRNCSVPCECKYCSKKPQREITSNMGQQGIIASSPGPSNGSPSRSQQQRKPRPEASGLKNAIVYAAVQKKKPSHSLVQKHPAPVEQVNDLDAMHRVNEVLELRRWYRNDELVWVELEVPIVGTKGEDDVIKAWPAIVEDASTRSTSTDLSPLENNESASTSAPLPQNATSYPTYNPESPPWTISQYTKYRLKLLGTSCSLMARDDQVLPYQAYMPPKGLIDELQDVPLSSIKFDTEYTSTFTPVNSSNPNEAPSPPPTFEESTGPYALAIQIASQMSGFWGLTDDWDFKYTFHDQGHRTLQDVISAASNSNAANAEGPTSYGTTSISGNRRMTASELEKTKSATLGTPKPINHQISQKRFHGLWWGAERIWTGDLLRLKMGRKGIAPDGGPHIVPASKAGPGALWNAVTSGQKLDEKEEKMMGASSRGVFMRLDALFMVEVDIGHGRKRNECRAAGPLYELADNDWVDPLEKSNGVSSNQHLQPSLSTPSLPRNHVPAEQTAASQVLPALKPNGAFKPPIPVTYYELPQAPIGYKFRPILEPGYEAVFSLTLLSGRYYPGILNHPLLSEAITTAFTEDGIPNPQTAHLWPLEGLEPGFANSVDPIRFKKDRLKMVVDAEQHARAQLMEHLDGSDEMSNGPEMANGTAEITSVSAETVNGPTDMLSGSAELVKPEAMEVDQLMNDNRMQVDT